MEATVVMDDNPQTWERGLEGLIAINEEHMDNGLGFPPLYQSGIKYRPEKNSEKWLSIRQVYAQGHGDCEDLTGIRCAELRSSGLDEGARAYIYQTGPKRWHAVVLRSDGVIEDPTKILKRMEKASKKAQVNTMDGEKNNMLGFWGGNYADPYGTAWADPSQYQDPMQQFYSPDYYSGYGFGGYGAFGGMTDPSAWYAQQYSPYQGYQQPFGYDQYGGGYGYGEYGQAGYSQAGYGYPYGQGGYDQYAQQEQEEMHQYYEQAFDEAEDEINREKARMRKRRELQRANRQRRQQRRQAQREKRRQRKQALRQQKAAARQQRAERRAALREERRARRQARQQREAERRAAKPRGWHL